MDPFRKIRAYHTGAILQITDWLVVMPYLRHLAKQTAEYVRLDYAPSSKETIEKDIAQGAVFLTNHRDICMDSAWLSMLLRGKYNIRPYIGIGNNLFGKWWIEFFVRINRCFVVIRNGSPRELLQNSITLSEYIHHLRHRNKSIWLAQREGRAKDSNDMTQPAVLKMLTLEQPDLLSAIRALNICPVCISYEYDPCDYLKAQEFQQKRDDSTWKKKKEDDLLSMKTGIFGKKGQVIFRMTPSINHWLDEHEAELQPLSRNEQLQKIATQIDLQLHANYEIFPRGTEFAQYIEQQIAKVQLPRPDYGYLKERIQEMYNNPVKNYEKSHLSGQL